MSNTNPVMGRNLPKMPELPQGAVVSTYDHYVDAMHAVDKLAQANFPVGQVSIMGNDVRSIERVTGKLSYGRVAWMGAFSGAYFGLFIGILLFLFQPENESVFGIFLAAIVIGAGFGMLFGVLSYALNRDRRDFSSVMQFVAARYDLITAPELVGQARTILSGAEAE